jgi:hypothetical protein
VFISSIPIYIFAYWRLFKVKSEIKHLSAGELADYKQSEHETENEREQEIKKPLTRNLLVWILAILLTPFYGAVGLYLGVESIVNWLPFTMDDLKPLVWGGYIVICWGLAAATAGVVFGLYYWKEL